MEIFAAALLAVALSTDGFGMGLAYGLRKIEVNTISIFLIVLCAALAMTLSILAGKIISHFIPYHLAGLAGGIILVALGFWQLLEGLKKYRESPVLISISFKTLGLVLQVIREPASADVDNSGDINYKEAFLLGIALNVDVIGAGFGAGVAGYSLYLIPIVALALFLALRTGLLIGKKCVASLLPKKGYIMPGMLLIILGLANALCR